MIGRKQQDESIENVVKKVLVLKNNTEFDAEIDRQNRKDKQLNKSGPKRKDKKRRFQKYDFKAPTSGRQYKKRKEQTQATSQNHKNN